MKLFILSFQVTFTLLLTFILGKWAFASGIVHSSLTSDIGSEIYLRILIALDNGGGEESEKLQIIMVLALMLIPSTLICRFVSRQLRRWLSNKTRQ